MNVTREKLLEEAEAVVNRGVHHGDPVYLLGMVCLLYEFIVKEDEERYENAASRDE
jgi:hypothetical protein